MNIGTVDVEIVRPKKTGRQNLAAMFWFLMGYLLNGFIVMLILDEITTLGISYWHSVLLVILVRTLVSNNEYFMWTKEKK